MGFGYRRGCMEFSNNRFIEKRAHPRVSLEIPLKCRLMDGMLNAEDISEVRKRAMKTISRDVSLGGMKIRRELPLDVGVIMALEFTLPEITHTLSAFAEVVW